MTKKFLLKWIKALESGEYNQGTEMLYNGDGKYCCLGVACHLLEINEDDMVSKGMPEDVLEEDSIVNPIFDLKLSKLNDDGYSFQQIAEYLKSGANLGTSNYNLWIDDIKPILDNGKD
ncbi:MAG: hypothetical protein ACXAC7_22950 [Candidatus Hodarchaeales archaeon]|jgi:hypothetical protein